MSGTPPDRLPPVRPQVGGFNRTTWVLMFLAMVGVTAVYAWLEIPAEIGRWHTAAAMEHWLNAEQAQALGDTARWEAERDLAFAKLNKALNTITDDPRLYMQRATWLRQVGKYDEALADCNQAVELAGEQSAILSERATIYQLQRNHAAAVKDWETIYGLSKTQGEPPIPKALNDLAYARSLGKIDLKDAFEEVTEALRSAPKSAAMLDTRAFIRYQMGDLKPALEDMNLAIPAVEAELEAETRKIAESRKSVDERRLAAHLVRARKGVAVLYYHRSLIYEKLGNASAAAADRKKAKELAGKEPDETLF